MTSKYLTNKTAFLGIFIAVVAVIVCGGLAFFLTQSEDESDPPPPTATALAETTPAPTPTTAALSSQTSPLPSPTADVITPNSPISPPGEAGNNASGDLLASVITFERNGGIAGIAEEWTLQPDGQITLKDGQTDDTQTWQIPAEQMTQLLTDIEALGFFALDGNYLPLDTCCDRITYQLTIQNEAGQHTISTLDAAPDVPETVWTILDKIGAVVDNLK